MTDLFFEKALKSYVQYLNENGLNNMRKKYIKLKYFKIMLLTSLIKLIIIRAKNISMTVMMNYYITIFIIYCYHLNSINKGIIT